jgi:hypothetical protein
MNTHRIPRLTDRLLGILLLSALFSITSFAADETAHTPPPGSITRKAICDAMRKLYAGNKYADQPLKAGTVRVLFEIDHLKVKNGWAAFSATPVQVLKSGQQVPMDTVHTAVLKLANNRWIVVLDHGWHGDVPETKDLIPKGGQRFSP